MQDVGFKFAHVEVIHADNDSANITFNWHWTGRAPDSGEAFEVIGRGSQTWVEHEGILKIKLEHLSR